MDTLPKFLPVFDGAWKPCGEGVRWKRLDTRDDSLLEEKVAAGVLAPRTTITVGWPVTIRALVPIVADVGK